MKVRQILKPLIRDTIASLLAHAGYSGFQRFPARSLTIVTFHRVLPQSLKEQYPLPGLAVTPEELSWVIRIMKPHFEIHTLTTAFERLVQSEHEKPLLAVTFDDAQWDNFKYGIPVLNDLNVKATFYAPTTFLGTESLLWHDEAAFLWQHANASNSASLNELLSRDPNYKPLSTVLDFLQFLKQLNPNKRQQIIDQLKTDMDEFPKWARLMTWDELRLIQDAGHEIGSHGKTHSLLSQQSVAHQKEELLGSFDDIASTLGVPPASFCYPDGNFDMETSKILETSPYKTAVTTNWGINKGNANRHQLNRCDINGQMLRDRKGALSKARLQLRISGLQPGL